MAFVKLDCGILNSSVWAESVLRDVFLTSLLMAEPYVTDVPLPQLHVRTMEPTGWVVPPGWYGFVPAAGIGIIRRALVINIEAGMDALERLGSAEPESRSQEFEGRRLVRVSGGYVALNYDKYRERDFSGAERQRRYRLRIAAQKALHVTPVTEEPVSSVTNVTSRRIVTQAEAEAEAEEEVQPRKIKNLDRLRDRFDAFWTVYPRKIGKGAALKEWRKLKASDVLTEQIIAAVQQQSKSSQWQKDGGQFIPHPKTWLSQGRWQDEAEAQVQRVMSDVAATVFETLREKL